jgi:hypothetical protein
MTKRQSCEVDETDEAFLQMAVATIAFRKSGTNYGWNLNFF